MNKYLKIAIYIGIFILLAYLIVYNSYKTDKYWSDLVLQELSDCRKNQDISLWKPACTLPETVWEYALNKIVTIQWNITRLSWYITGLVGIILLLFYKIGKLEEKIKHLKWGNR